MRHFAALTALFTFLIISASSGQIYHIDISDMIDLGLPPYIERVLGEAEAAGAKGVILEVNTFGGRVDAATQIKDILLNTPLETYAYVNKRAISAGALITLSCKNVGMTPGSSIGAATVVDQEGTKAAEKAQSYFRAEMGATAERNGRNRQVAEGMVDEDVEIEGLTEKGKLITLTADDALKWKITDYIAPSVEAYLDSVGLGEETVIYTDINWAEQVVRFLTNPIISGFLLSLGFIGLLFEIKSPGWGIPGSLGLLFLALFFGSHYIIKLASSIEIILFFIGVVLLIVEIFVLPGFGIAGATGIVCILAGAYLSLIGALELVSTDELRNAAYRLGGALAATVLASILFFRFGPRTGIWQKLALQPEQRVEEGYIATTDFSAHVGRTGVAITPLRPTGVGLFDKDRLDVVSEGGYVDANTPIEVVHYEGYRLIVREIAKKRKKKTA